MCVPGGHPETPHPGCREVQRRGLGGPKQPPWWLRPSKELGLLVLAPLKPEQEEPCGEEMPEGGEGCWMSGVEL